MGNWNRHFVRVDSNGNVGIFSPTNDEFAYLDDTYKDFIITPTSQVNAGSYVGINRQNTYANRQINGLPLTGILTDYFGNIKIDPYGTGKVLLSWDNSGTGIGSGYKWSAYMNNISPITFSMNGMAAISGTPDLRTDVTAADTSPITIFSSTVSGTRYEVKARILATAGSSATYTISWTEGGSVRTVALTVTAVGTEVHDNFVIAPDAGTNITAQITSLTSSTVNVDAIVSVLG